MTVAAIGEDVEVQEEMSDEKTARGGGEWTVETLREHFDAMLRGSEGKIQAIIAANDIKYLERFEASQVAAQIAFTAQQTAMLTALTAQKLAVDTALQAADRAGTKSEIAADKRFEGLNELRNMVSEQQANFMQRGESTVLFRSIEDKILTAQQTYEARHEAFRSSFEKSHEVLVKEVAAIRELQSNTSGKTAGMGAVAAYFIAAGSILVALITHFIK